MIDMLYILYAIVPAVLSALGTSIGQGFIGAAALQAMNRQPTSANAISKLCVIGMAITETAAVMGIVISIMMLGDINTLQNSNYANYGAAGIAIAMGLSGFCAGIASAFPAVATCHSVASQPFLQTKLLNLMLITQTLIMTPNMFGMLISLLIKSKIHSAATVQHGFQMLAAGISIGLGCIGPSIGLSLFAFAACHGVGTNKQAFGKIMTFTFICEAIIETPAIFSLLISLMILTTAINPESFIQSWQFIAAAICIGLSTISPGINSGRTGAMACTQIALHLDQYPSLSKITMLALAMIDSFAIYGLLIAIVMLLF
ncbi:hypothetical protein KBD08_00640 [Candidatus Babeliales bacterium]|nr:hypothetical protein [Candidatus Babeliales bacterium]